MLRGPKTRQAWRIETLSMAHWRFGVVALAPRTTNTIADRAGHDGDHS